MPEHNSQNGRQKNRTATTQPNHDAGGQAALEPLSPAEAVDLFLEHRKGEVSHRTRRKDRYKLKPFVEWCEQEGIENLNNLSGRDLFRYRTWRKEDGDLTDMSLRTQLSSVRVFLRFCVQIDGVPSWLPDQMMMPSVDDEVRQEHLAPERGDRIRSHLQRFDYCSQKHVVYELLWVTSMRMGSLRALDVCDFEPDNKCLRLRHRPPTNLKNGNSSERRVAIPEETVQLLSDWLDHNRPDVTDDQDRQPLVASSRGRMSASNIRGLIYSVTRPCYIGADECCSDCYDYDSASKCQLSRSPHCLRKGSLTKHLKAETPIDVLSDRADCSPSVLSKHYDQMTESEKMEQRRDILDFD